MRIIYTIAGICLSITCSFAFAQENNEQLLDRLNRTIDSAGAYDSRKVSRIESLKKNFASAGDKSSLSAYEFYLRLYEEYKIFRFDTAFLYAKKLEETAAILHDPFKTVQSRIKLAFVLLSAGMYKEADELLEAIDITRQPIELKAEYYLLKGRFYYDLADYTSDDFFYPGYFKKAGENLDSALGNFSPASFEYIYYSGLKQIKRGDLDKGFNNLQVLMKKQDLTDHQLAVAASTLSYIFFRKGITDSLISYQARAAIADIRSSTKETFAILNLSQILFGVGGFDRASLYIKKAVDDASFYGARQRKIQVSTILPIIQSSEINYVKKQRRSWIIYGAIVSAFLLLFTFLLITIRRQNKSLQQAQKKIADAHETLHTVNSRLTQLNTELQTVNAHVLDVNARLEEANKIKEEYVGYMFTLDTTFFQKIDKFTKAIEEKIHFGKLNDIKYIVNTIKIKDEKEELVKRFDKVFLKLFPHFVQEFNTLFEEGNQVKLRDGELLNTDLRIFALQRLGIKENEKIAEILEYSVKSIYSYKTRIRKRSIFTKEEFDKKIMEIGSLS